MTPTRHGPCRFCAGWLQFALIFMGLATTAGAADTGGLLHLGGHHVKWGEASYGSPARVTYAYLDRVRTFPNARNCASMLPTALLYRISEIDQSDFHLEVEAAFALWSNHANISFRRIDQPGQADILIGAQDSSYGVAYANVFPAAQVTGKTAITPIAKATICLDPGERWELGRDGDPATYNLRRVMAHEIGHAIGLDHLGSDGGLMGYAYPEPATGPLAKLEPADIAAVVRLYGSPMDQQIPLASLAGTAPAAVDTHGETSTGPTRSQPPRTARASTQTAGCVCKS